jgi:hypothetical protein
MKLRVTLNILVSAALVGAVLIAAMPGQRGDLTGDDISRFAKSLKTQMKAELAAGGKLYEPGAFPSGWGFSQRAYPHGRIDHQQLKQAVIDAQAMRIEARKMAGPLSPVWAEEGPTNIGARITDLAMHASDPNTIYAAVASGGVFRSTNGGSTWDPISDDLPVLTIGAIALDPVDPDIIYVGTGEANASSYSWFGMGMYKSTDAGANWSYIGLEDTRYIGRIVVDPMDRDRIWVAGTGALFGTNPERGIYRSTDAGATWDKVLFVSDSTAAIDVAIDPTRPDTVFAAMWERRRGLTYRKSGGWSTGIYRSYDGGDSWTELTNGLPKGSDVGRPGISVCESSPNVIYAMYCDHPGYFLGVYKSTDGGNSWSQTNDGVLSSLTSSFGWYFGQIRVDPSDPDRVFAMGVPFYRSENGGATWYEVGPANHVDHHAMVFDPTNHSRIFEGNDGGIYISLNSGTSWTKLYDQHTNQFYAIEIDYLNPQRLYGGTQDNGTLRTVTGSTDDWEGIFGGDGFYTIVDPTNSNIIYAEYQFGNLFKSTDFADSWDYAMDGVNFSDRFNWSMPVVMDPSDHETLYLGSHRVYETTNGAAWWDLISSDLTNGNQGAGFGTITTLAVAPTDPDVIYVGTDDSNVWVTQNGGGGWTNISSTLPNRWVTRVAVDPTDEATAYVSFSGMRWDENIGYVYRTSDYGSSWTDITYNLPLAPVNVVIVDPGVPSRVFAGSDVGCFWTDAAATEWWLLGSGLPPAPVYDIKIHNPTRTLVAGTHGRSMYSIDLTTLPAVAGTPEAEAGVARGVSSHPNPFKGSTSLAFTLAGPSEVSVEIYDLAGRKVRSLGTRDLGAGKHQVTWDGRNASGRSVAPGVYFARLDAANQTSTTTLIKR